MLGSLWASVLFKTAALGSLICHVFRHSRAWSPVPACCLIHWRWAREASMSFDTLAVVSLCCFVQHIASGFPLSPCRSTHWRWAHLPSTASHHRGLSQLSVEAALSVIVGPFMLW